MFCGFIVADSYDLGLVYLVYSVYTVYQLDDGSNIIKFEGRAMIDG
jgi:hypothetical protein